jgi:RND family efflux transporter MFP subunit
MKSRIISIIILVALLAGAGILLKRSHDKINSGKTNSGISSEIVVDVTDVGETSTGSTLNLTGTLTPYTELNIAAQVSGQITSLNVELGQYKAKGSVLATIDNKLKQLAVQSAKLNMDKQKRDLARYENLYQGGTITAQQMDDARTSYESAQIQLDQAKKQLIDATVTAPVNGIITEKSAERGSFINTGNPIAHIVDISRLKIKMNVSEQNVYKLKKGDDAVVTSDIYPGTTFHGRISFISEKGDEAHNYQVEVEMPNNSKTPLKAGTFANVQIDAPGRASALSIPRTALLGSTQNARVYVVEQGKAVQRPIVIGGGNEKYLEVVSGLAKGEKVVVAGQINLIDGQPVKIGRNN